MKKTHSLLILQKCDEICKEVKKLNRNAGISVSIVLTNIAFIHIVGKSLSSSLIIYVPIHNMQIIKFMVKLLISYKSQHFTYLVSNCIYTVYVFMEWLNVRGYVSWELHWYYPFWPHFGKTVINFFRCVIKNWIMHTAINHPMSNLLWCDFAETIFKHCHPGHRLSTRPYRSPRK